MHELGRACKKIVVFSHTSLAILGHTNPAKVAKRDFRVLHVKRL